MSHLDKLYSILIARKKRKLVSTWLKRFKLKFNWNKSNFLKSYLTHLRTFSLNPKCGAKLSCCLTPQILRTASQASRLLISLKRILCIALTQRWDPSWRTVLRSLRLSSSKESLVTNLCKSDKIKVAIRVRMGRKGSQRQNGSRERNLQSEILFNI